MKITFKALFCLLLITSLCIGAKAQSHLPDTLRIGVGLEGISTTGGFSKSYNSALGGSLRADIPVTGKWYATVSVGFNNFFTATDVAANDPRAILNVTTPSLQTIPLKVGLKYMLIGTFYLQGEVGETLLANKAKVYAISSSAFTYAPQLGMIFPLKKHTYIDAGVRYEFVSSFYNDDVKNNFWAAHVAYTFNL
jgi:hypothetical protein